MEKFQRARTDEQREERREAILTAARGMLDEQRVAALSLNELSRHAGLAKSNVLRYFESREAVLLELYDREYRGWLDALAERLADARPASIAEGIELAASAIADTVAQRPVFCELSASAPGVLEHNVSAQVAADYKRGALTNSARLAALVSPLVGGLPGLAETAFLGGVTIMIGGVWAQSQPSEGMAAAYRAHPELRVMRLELAPAVRELVATLLVGLQHRVPRL